MNFTYNISTDKGDFRESNQDCAYANVIETQLGKFFLGIVCDGMGGLTHGEVASRTVVQSFSEWFENELRYIISDNGFEEIIAAQWQQIIINTNNSLRNLSMQGGCSMGTTLSVLLLARGRFYIAQIGDSRVYIGGEGGFFNAVTRDHSYVAEKVEQGLMTAEEARLSREKNILTRCIGVMEWVDADYFSGEICKGDYFVICSDGFCSGALPEHVFAAMGGTDIEMPKVKTALDTAIAARRSTGERDNITAVFVAVS